MRILKVLFVAAFFVGTLAMAEQAATPQTSESGDKATLYVYRYKQFVGKALSPSVYCDEAELARMVNGRYFTVKLDPGKHSFRSNDKQSGIDLNMESGKSYFVRLEIATGFLKGHGRLTLMAGEQAAYELKQLKPLDDDKVVDKGKVSVAEVNFDATPAKPAAQAEQPKPAEAAAPASESKPALVPVSGNDVSLGEAARKAKEKKQQQPPQ